MSQNIYIHFTQIIAAIRRPLNGSVITTLAYVIKQMTVTFQTIRINKKLLFCQHSGKEQWDTNPLRNNLSVHSCNHPVPEILLLFLVA
jgi:hypothetical protein